MPFLLYCTDTWSEPHDGDRIQLSSLMKIQHQFHIYCILQHILECFHYASTYVSTPTLLNEHTPEYTLPLSHTNKLALTLLVDAIQIHISHAAQFGLTCSTLIIQ